MKSLWLRSLVSARPVDSETATSGWQWRRIEIKDPHEGKELLDYSAVSDVRLEVADRCIARGDRLQQDLESLSIVTVYKLLSNVNYDDVYIGGEPATPIRLRALQERYCRPAASSDWGVGARDRRIYTRIAKELWFDGLRYVINHHRDPILLLTFKSIVEYIEALFFCQRPTPSPIEDILARTRDMRGGTVTRPPSSLRHRILPVPRADEAEEVPEGEEEEEGSEEEPCGVSLCSADDHVWANGPEIASESSSMDGFIVSDDEEEGERDSTSESGSESESESESEFETETSDEEEEDEDYESGESDDNELVIVPAPRTLRSHSKREEEKRRRLVPGQSPSAPQLSRPVSRAQSPHSCTSTIHTPPLSELDLDQSSASSVICVPSSSSSPEPDIACVGVLKLGKELQNTQ